MQSGMVIPVLGRQGEEYFSHTYRASSTELPRHSIGAILQRQLMRDRDSSLTLMTSGPALPPASGVDGCGVGVMRGGGMDMDASLLCPCHHMTDE